MRASLLTCCWPGLTKLWLYGQWNGFVAAGVFTLLLNFALAATFLESPSLGSGWRITAWVLAVGFWAISFWGSRREQFRRQSQERVACTDMAEGAKGVDLYPQAQTEYLKGNWFEAERLLDQAIVSRPSDVDAHLMLAALFRHTERFEECGRQLTRLSGMPGAEKWYLEIFREKELLNRLKEDRLTDEPDDADRNPQAA
ncbi:GtrA domain-containing protein [Lignipirellula cremea]|uniref:Tetratricopeptide repeat protein n=1 Tax=Lignipirellula cremea TaxID=2528010 RepID=A0A518DXW5_9BACT|nr:hypothetical protein [Lignipirellula cremea]QDU96635.1 hypothetical protein Pla8534_44560 [Lignipirellula cremea]